MRLKLVNHTFEYNEKYYTFYAWSEACCLYQQWKKYDTFYEIGVLEAIKSLNVERDFLDIGANVGNHAVFFEKECGLSGVCFEPDNRHFMCLHYNCWFNDCEYLMSPFAASNRAHKVKLIQGPQAPEHLWIEDGGMIQAYRMDRITEIRERKIGLIKVDVEGSEFQALKGCEDVIKRDKPVICAEAVVQHKYDKINKYLQKIGYSDLMGNVCTHGEAPTFLWGF